jgi:hypothetical protein
LIHQMALPQFIKEGLRVRGNRHGDRLGNRLEKR